MDKFLRTQIFIFLLSFLSNVTRHSLMESWYMVKVQVKEDLGLSTLSLGVIDMLFLFFYALGNVVNGLLADRYGAKRVLCFGMLFSGLVHTGIALAAVLLVKSPVFYALFFLVGGFFQGSIWVCTVSILGNWFSEHSRGKVMGFWIINTSVGNLFGSQVTSGLISSGVEWQHALIFFIYFYTASLYLNIGFLKEKPSHAQQNEDKRKKISLIHAYKLPGVFIYSLVFACMKLIHYSFLMWLPSYVYNKLEESEYSGGVMVSLYDVGGLFGSIIIGWVSDRIPSRVYAFFPLMIGCVPLLFSFSLGTNETLWLFYCLIPFVGLILGGVTMLISSAVAADLGSVEDDGAYDARTTVIGIIDGSGGVGAGIGQIVIGKIQKKSWDYVFYFLTCVNIFVCLLILPLVIKTVKMNKQESAAEAKFQKDSE